MRSAPRADWFGLEPELSRRLVGCESDALECFFDAAFEPIYAFTRRMLRDDASARDVTQDVFVKLLRALPGYRSELPLRPWVFAIASNALRDHFAARAIRERTIEESLDTRMASDSIDSHRGANPSARIEESELAARIERGLLRLPPLLRSAVVLRYVQGLGYEEIAITLSTSEDTVRQRCSRAMRELRCVLGDLKPDHGRPS